MKKIILAVSIHSQSVPNVESSTMKKEEIQARLRHLPTKEMKRRKKN